MPKSVVKSFYSQAVPLPRIVLVDSFRNNSKLHRKLSLVPVPFVQNSRGRKRR